MFTLSISCEDKSVLERIRKFLKEHLYVSAFDSVEFDLTQTIHYPIDEKKDKVAEYCANDVRTTKALSQPPFEIGDFVVLKDNPHGPVYRVMDWEFSETTQVGLRYMGHGGPRPIVTYVDPEKLKLISLDRPKYSIGDVVSTNGTLRFIFDYRVIWHNGYDGFVHQYKLDDDSPSAWWAEQEINNKRKVR